METRRWSAPCRQFSGNCSTVREGGREQLMDKAEDDERGFFSEMATPPPSPAPQASRKSREKPHYVGHRDRLRERFREHGADSLPDYELLELLLFRSIPRADTKETAKALIARFGSFAEVLGAPDHLLREVPGVGE